MQLIQNTYFGENNRYYLEKLLGRGGFSEVWLVKDSITNLELALKVYAPGMGMDEDGLQTFSQELARVYNLNHTNLLKPQHVDSWQGMPYLTMSYCPQGSLVKRIGKMSEQEIRKVIHDVAAGLAYLHERDIIHQDIKPDNILIDSVGNYVITDFGISTRARSTLRKSVAASSANSGGTIAYMGPERFGKEPAPIKASDIWSLGAMCYELMTGNTPFGEHGGLIQKSGAEIPNVQGNYSNELKQIVEQMLSLDPWDRPTAAALAEGHFSTPVPERNRPTVAKTTCPTQPTVKFPKYAKIVLGVLIAVYVFMSVGFTIESTNCYEHYSYALLDQQRIEREPLTESVYYNFTRGIDAFDFVMQCEGDFYIMVTLTVGSFIALLLLSLVYFNKRKISLYAYILSIVVDLVIVCCVAANYRYFQYNNDICFFSIYPIGVMVVTLAIFFIKFKGTNIYSMLK